jgi:CBS domain-containing protein
MFATPTEKFLLEKSATIADALFAITENKHGAILIVDTDKTLVGVVSDGDIRRALVKGATTLTPVEKITNQNVQCVRDNSNKGQSDKIFTKHPAINVIPVLDKSNRVRDVVTRS